LFNDIRELKEGIENIEGFLNRMIALGKVVAIDESKAMVRVELGEHDKVVSYWLPVLHHKTQHDKEYWLPDIDEFVLCVFTPPDFQRGFVIGAVYTEEDKPPEANRNKWIKRFKDETTLEYDRENHKLTIDVKGDLIINTSGNITIEANGNIVIKGSRIDLNP
jgi:phage baseplate assembly protein V